MDGIDNLEVLEDWREHDKAPAALTAYRLHDYGGKGSFWPQKTPPDLANIAFGRPMLPYPNVARYKGSGDLNAASSFGSSNR